MADLAVERLMSTDLLTIESGASAATAARHMLETGKNSILVVDGDHRLKGLITATDFVSLVRENDPEDETPVEAFMTTDVVTVGPDDTVEELAEPTAHGYTHLPVVDRDGALIGMVSTTDLTAYLSGRR
ncbi:signal transduction protein with CBS domains [Halorubrum saccharovorum DSM 1137]|uniref:Signal transduction protein with CBS domains n=1 Tax=Halorubrum saccharovorum DSM 1137 TaxID=1227484 RepID=M0DNE7_9EURY|nr:CBS domain-containing protein [Halorubrum saccharovorum]ELZ37001.1 signal transduction protein with CBS domains [Halorubrum saccharovorum DSM 1137]